jgi:5-methylcytosine-specific restriction endonuclease McrA
MPSPKGYKRDYKQEAKTAKRRGEQGTGSSSGSAKRHRARRKMLKAGKVKKGQDVNHKRPIRSGGSNAPSNLEATSKKKNRSFPRKGLRSS